MEASVKGLMEILSGDGFGERSARDCGRPGAGVIVGCAIAETEGRRGRRMERMETTGERCIVEAIVEWRRVEEEVVVGGGSVVQESSEDSGSCKLYLRDERMKWSSPACLCRNRVSGGGSGCWTGDFLLLS